MGVLKGFVVKDHLLNKQRDWQEEMLQCMKDWRDDEFETEFSLTLRIENQGILWKSMDNSKNLGRKRNGKSTQSTQ